MASSSSSSPQLPLSRSTNNPDPSLSIDAKLHQVLEDLSSRFILNLPDGELGSLERVCFQVEQAHWYYEDFIREQDPSLPTMTLKRFSNSLFHVCPLLSHWGDAHEQTFQNFLAYKTRVPVCGAIMLNESRDKCLLVKGWKATSAWSFPKGKINQTEQRPACAVREVLEETGYDLSEQIDPSNVVELSIRDQSLSLYIVPNVPEDFPFETRTRKEISKIAWFKLSDLPTWKRNKMVPGKFYLITPFIGPLKAFLRSHKARDFQPPGSKYNQVDVDPHLSSEDDTRDSPAIAHESSSQSSLENGDPHTPSPLYTEPVISHAENGVSHAMQKTLNIETVDPHFARLLSSLSLSVSTTSSTNSLEKVDSVSTLAIAKSQPQLPPVHELPQSVHLQSQPVCTHARIASQADPAPRTTRSPSVAPITSPTPSSTATIQRAPSRLGRGQTSPPAQMAGLSQHVPSSGVYLTHSPTIRRGVAPVPASPFLSQAGASATVPLPKQMKYISMLENVAKQSERMTPRLERQMQAAPSLPSMHEQYRSFPPVLPTNVVPAAHSESPLLYSSHSSVSIPPAPFNGQHAPPFHQPLSQMDDAFVVRPRTSNSFHPLQPNLFAPRPPSLNDPGRYGPPGQQLGHAPLPPMYPSFPPQGRLPGPGPGSDLRIVPPQQLGVLPQASPLSAPAISPKFNLFPRNSTNNLHLLQILNGPGILRATPHGP